MRRYLIFVVAAIVLMLWSIDATIVAVAIPVIVSSFHTSLILAGWTLSAYQVPVTACIPLSGKISDVLGRKFTFMLSLSLFTAGSLLCSIAPNVQSLIIFRLIQGLGGSGFLPSANGIAAEEFPRSRQQAIGLFSSIVPIGWIIGPNLGGWMITILGWRSIFWINIPLGIVSLVGLSLLLPAGQRKKTHIDLAGAGLLVGALVALMTGLSEMGSSDGSPPWGLVGLLLSSGLGILTLFWRRQTRVKDPVIEPEVLRQRPFLAANVFNFTYGGAVGALSFVPLYAVSIYGMSTLQSGLVLTPRSIGVIAASLVTSLSLVRWGYRWPMLVGTVVMIPAFILLALEPTSFGILGSQLSSIVFLLIIMGVLGLGMGTIAPAANNACIELMPQRVGTITALRSMFRQAGQVTSIITGSLLLDTVGMTRGFQLFFLGLATLAVLILMPAIFAMPRSPSDLPEVGVLWSGKPERS